MTTWNIAFAWKVSVNSICSQGMSDFFPYTFQGMCSGAASPRIRSLSFQLSCGMVKDLRSCFREEPLTYFSISGNNSWGKKKIQSEFHVCIAVQDRPSSVFCWEMPEISLLFVPLENSPVSLLSSTLPCLSNISISPSSNLSLNIHSSGESRMMLKPRLYFKEIEIELHT